MDKEKIDELLKLISALCDLNETNQLSLINGSGYEFIFIRKKIKPIEGLDAEA